VARARRAVAPSCIQPRGALVSIALLVEYYRQFLPQLKRRQGAALQRVLDKFKNKTAARYTEGTLQRLAETADAETRRATVLALGLLGTMTSNEALAERLHDEDGQVRRFAVEALWTLWFRGDDPERGAELRRLIRMSDRADMLCALDALIAQAPEFAEAYNQRAVVHFRNKDFEKSLADCERVLSRNPHHFGALSGMAECFVNLRRPRAALKAYRNAYRINPNLGGVKESIESLEATLGEEGRMDDRK
jgi:tetratricopeptide (TPR) repeat protein